jgi:hypothetical protein
MFDKGYLRGDANLALICGRKSDEVDLHVYLRRAPPYRVPWRKLSVHGNMPASPINAGCAAPSGRASAPPRSPRA